MVILTRRKPSKLHIGTAGIPISTPKKTTPEGVKRVAELDLDAMEIEFVRGVRMSEQLALKTREVANELNVLLTVHAPYYINLLSPDESKVKASIKRIIDSARIGYLAGAWSVVFHPGYYGKLKSDEAVRIVRNHIKEIVKMLRDQGIEIWVRPEIMGGLSEFGSLDEILEVVNGIDMAAPCIDFAHLYARTLGEYNNYEKFREVLSKVEERLGREALDNAHIHVSGMEYGSRGEKKHLNFNESMFNWRDVVKVVKEFNVKGVVISESPNLEGDAILFKKEYESV